MKNILSFLIIAALSMPAISSAQEHRGWAAGIKGGPLYGTVMGTLYQNIHTDLPGLETRKSKAGGFGTNSYLNGFAAIYSDYRFNDSWSLGSEIGFVMMEDAAFMRSNWVLKPKEYDRFNLYVAPAIAKYYIPKTKGLHLTLGPELRIHLGDRYFNFFGNPGSAGCEFKYNSVAFAINSGIGYRFKFGMTLQAEYSAGLTRMVSKKSDDKYFFLRVHDDMFRFSLSYDLFKRRK